MGPNGYEKKIYGLGLLIKKIRGKRK